MQHVAYDMMAMLSGRALSDLNVIAGTVLPNQHSPHSAIELNVVRNGYLNITPNYFKDTIFIILGEWPLIYIICHVEPIFRNAFMLFNRPAKWCYSSVNRKVVSSERLFSCRRLQVSPGV